MKYKLLKELPFMVKGSVFGKGCWVGGGFGIDRGNDVHGSHNGVTVFTKAENEVLESVIGNKDWIEKIPESKNELVALYDDKEITRAELLARI